VTITTGRSHPAPLPVASMRASLPFRAVNRRDSLHYDPALQRHHLLPRQLCGLASFAALFEAVGRRRIGFEDFRRNGLLLPAREQAAVRLGLPLHRGPHHNYNAMVIDRVGEIELDWHLGRRRNSDRAGELALMRLALLQQSLRQSLIEPQGEALRLNRHDPLGTGFDFAELDAMAERLWAHTQAVAADSATFAS